MPRHGTAADRRRDPRASTAAPTASAGRASAALAKLRGHAWQAALFPSGRGFGYIAYPPRDDGKDTYNEGYLFDGDGDLIPARVVEAPWLRTLTPKGEDVSCVLETEDGRTVDASRARRRCRRFMVMPPEVGGGLQLQQAIVRYTLGRRDRQRHARALDAARDHG